MTFMDYYNSLYLHYKVDFKSSIALLSYETDIINMI